MKSKKKHAKKQAKAVNKKNKHKKSTNRFDSISEKALQDRIVDLVRT